MRREDHHWSDNTGRCRVFMKEGHTQKTLANPWSHGGCTYCLHLVGTLNNNTTGRHNSKCLTGRTDCEACWHCSSHFAWELVPQAGRDCLAYPGTLTVPRPQLHVHRHRGHSRIGRRTAMGLWMSPIMCCACMGVCSAINQNLSGYCHSNQSLCLCWTSSRA